MATANLLLNIQQQGVDAFANISRNLNILTGTAIGELSELETASESSSLAIRQIGDTLDQSFDGLGGSTVEITNEFNQLDKQVTRSLSNVSNAAKQTVAAVMNIDDGIATSVNEIRQDVGVASTAFDNLNRSVVNNVERIRGSLVTVGTAAFDTLNTSVRTNVESIRNSLTTVGTAAFGPLQKGVQTATNAVAGLGSIFTNSLQGALFATINILNGQVNPTLEVLSIFITNNYDSIVLFGRIIISASTALIALLTALNPVTASLAVLVAGVTAALVRFEPLRRAVLDIIDALVHFAARLAHPLELLKNLAGSALNVGHAFDEFKGTLTGTDDVFNHTSDNLRGLVEELKRTSVISRVNAHEFEDVLTPAIGGNFLEALVHLGSHLATSFLPQLTVLRVAAGPIADVLFKRVIPAFSAFLKSSVAVRIALAALKFAAIDILVKTLQRLAATIQNNIIKSLLAMTNALTRLVNVPFTKLVVFLREQVINTLLILERVLVTGVIIAFRDTVQVIDTVVIQTFARLFNAVVRLANLFRGDAVESLVFLGNIAIQAGNGFRQLASNFLEFTRIGQAATGIFNTISGVIQQLFARLSGLFTIVQQFFGVDITIPFDLLQASLRDLGGSAVNTARDIGDNLTEKVASARIEFDRAKQSVIDYYTPLDELEKRSNAAADAIGNTVDAANRAADAQDKAAEAEADSVGTSRNAAAERERIANETAERERERARRSASDIIGRAQARQREELDQINRDRERNAQREQDAAERRAQRREEQTNRARSITENAARLRDERIRREAQAERTRARDEERATRERQRREAEAAREQKRLASERERQEKAAAAAQKAREDAAQKELEETNAVVKKLIDSYPLLTARANQIGESTENLTDDLREEVRIMREVGESIEDIGEVAERVFNRLPQYADDWQLLGYRMGQTRTQTTQMTKAMSLLSQAFPLISLGVLAARITEVGTAAIRAEFQIGRLRDQSGVSATTLKIFADAARRIGLEVDDVSGFMETFVDRLDEALEGSGEGFKTFNRLGISLRDAGGQVRLTEDILRDTIVALGDLEDGTLRAAIATAAFGGDGFKLVQAVSRSGEEIGKLNQDLERQTSEIKTLNETWGVFIGLFQEGFANAFKAIAPALDNILLILTVFLTSIGSVFAKLEEIFGLFQFLTDAARGLNVVLRDTIGLRFPEPFRQARREIEMMNDSLEENRDLTAEAFQNILNDINARQRDLFDASTARVLQEEAAARGITTPIRPDAAVGGRIIGPSTSPVNLIQGSVPTARITDPDDPLAGVPIINVNVNNVDPNMVADEVYKAIDREQQPGGALQITR